MKENHWYTLSNIDSFIINPTTSRRIYVAYNTHFKTYGNTIPSILTSNDVNNNRFDKIEPTLEVTTSKLTT